jgi:glycosyltransferase involved in cell wall biosynthesis
MRTTQYTRQVGNLAALIKRVYAALDEHGMAAKTEMIIVDDNSRDGSVEAVYAVSSQYPLARIEVRCWSYVSALFVLLFVVFLLSLLLHRRNYTACAALAQMLFLPCTRASWRVVEATSSPPNQACARLSDMV